MKQPKEVSAKDPCPQCGGTFKVDESQHPDRLIDRHTRVSASPHVSARYAEQVREKVQEAGILHKCSGCDYHARFVPEKPKPAEPREPQPA